jgi:hypothetical protein
MPIISFRACLLFLSWKGTHVGLRAAVGRGPSQGARSGSTGPTWVSFQSFLSWGLCEQRRHLAAPLPSSKLARSLSGMGAIDLPLRASNECWFIWSISSIWFVWLIGLEIHSEEPDRPERPVNQTDEPARVARAQKIIRLHPLLFREHRPIYAPSKLACDTLQRVAWISSNVRASNEALLRARVPRAQELTRLPSPPLAPAAG